MAQAARLSGYHEDYLGQLARTGKLKAEKRGHDWLTTSDDLNEYLKTVTKHSGGPRANLGQNVSLADDHASEVGGNS